MIIPTLVIGYDDRFLVPMLEARQRQAEEHGLMGLARSIADRIREVREWQVLHPDLGIATGLSGRPRLSREYILKDGGE